MKLTLLGSAAAEGIPALFCVCEICRQARVLGGRDLRRRTSYLLGDTVMVDWGPDAYATMIAMGLDYSPLTDLLITHSHADHLSVADLEYRRESFARLPEHGVLTVHGNSHSRRRVMTELEYAADRGLEHYRMRFDLLSAGDRRELSAVSVEAIEASHADEEEALNYIFTPPAPSDGCCLIANDTGWWPEPTWERLAMLPGEGRRLSVVVLDATSGLRPPTGHHNNAERVVGIKREMTRLGCLTENVQFIANHFSHNGGMLHADLERYYHPHGIAVGFDGMQVEL